MGRENSGRRPKPTVIHLLNGNPSKKHLDPDSEPKPPEGPVEPPEMSDKARKVWDKLAPKCLEMGTLTSVDGEAFATFCELQATLAECSRMKNAKGFQYLQAESETAGARVRENPVIKLERNTAMALRPYYERFGLEPSARSRIHVKKPEAPASKWAGLVG